MKPPGAATLGTALAFARRGLAVFPVHWPVPHPRHPERQMCSCGKDLRGAIPCASPAKHPYGRLAPNGLLSATTDAETIRRWFADVPMANLGVCTDKLVVIDIDPRHGGDESFAALEREHGHLPLTWRVLTGGGGEHLIFRCPDGIEIKNVVAEQEKHPPLGPGIDVRARGGYIVAPPSQHMSGRSYEWSVDHHPQNTRMTLAPDWLIARLNGRATTNSESDAPPEPIPSDTWAQLTRQPITEYHDAAAAKIAGHFFRHSCDYQLVLGLLHTWNTAWCKAPLGYHELEKIVARIADREAARIEKELAQ